MGLWVLARLYVAINLQCKHSHEWAFGVGLVTVLQVLCVADSLPLSNLLCSWSLMLTDLLSSIGMHALPDFAIQQFAATSLP